MGQILLYLWSGTRRHILERHDFYVAQVQAKVLSQFEDIEGDADRFADSEYRRLGAMPGSGDWDMGDVADTVRDRAYGHYALLSDLRQRLVLGALAGMYHQWDKDLRGFLERELARDIDRKVAEKVSWHNDFGAVVDLLGEFGWDCRVCSFFSRLEACRLVVNVHKHGKGASLDKLASSFPEFLPNPLAVGENAPFFTDRGVDHERLTVTGPQFVQIAEGIRSFWEAFPERLHLTTT